MRQKIDTLDTIKIHYNHELADIDFEKKLLKFRLNGDLYDPLNSMITVDASMSRVIGSDGAYSKVRTLLVDYDRFYFFNTFRKFDEHKTSSSITNNEPRFKDCITIPWTFKFRVLNLPLNIKPSGLNDRHSYIFSGCYTSFVNNRWTVVVVWYGLM